MNMEPKIQDVLDAINDFATDTQKRLGTIESTMVTQTVFQRALDSVEDRLTTEIKGQNRKLIAVVRLLEQKKIFTANEVQELSVF